MIVKNEEDRIGRCLSSVRDLVEEIIVVDTGSTDGTKDVCGKFADRLLEFEWIDDFSAARNFSFEHATKDFIFWLDADDVLSEVDRQKFAQLKKTLGLGVDAVSMEYQLAFDRHGRPTHSLRRHRLIKRSNGFRWLGAVHEYIEVRGHIVHSDVAVQHRPASRDPNRNIRIYEKRLAEGTPFSPRDLYYYANELKDHRRFHQAIDYYERFLATGQGWVEDVIGACNKLSECYAHLHDEQGELASALRALQYDHPRAETCCRIGHVYFRKNDWATAAFWYQAAVASVHVKPDRVPMFQNAAYATWVPHLQLCICYDRMGARLLAYLHNEQAAKHIPEDERVLRNRAYLEPLARAEQDALRAKTADQFPQTLHVEDGTNQAPAGKPYHGERGRKP